MKIIVASAGPPFGNRTPWVGESAAALLREAGHQVESLPLPYTPDVPDILDQRLGFRLTEVESRCDLLIAIGVPAATLRHRRKVVWLDTAEEAHVRLSRTFAGQSLTGSARRADVRTMREAYRVFAASARIGDRWSDQGNVLAEVLYPCLSLRDTMEQQTAEPQRTFMALVSRSREQLALDSLKHTRESVRLMVIRGGEPGHQDTAALGVQGRVTLGHEADSSDHSAFCTAVLCLSENEDCYTREFLRAVHGGRCVIAAEDCGAAAEVLRHDAEAMIVPPRPEAIAAAMDRVAQDGAFARARATAALNAMQKLDIGPEHTVARLLS